MCTSDTLSELSEIDTRSREMGATGRYVRLILVLLNSICGYDRCVDRRSGDSYGSFDLAAMICGLSCGDDLELGTQLVQAWLFKLFNVPEIFKGVEWI